MNSIDFSSKFLSSKPIKGKTNFERLINHFDELMALYTSLSSTLHYSAKHDSYWFETAEEGTPVLKVQFSTPKAMESFLGYASTSVRSFEDFKIEVTTADNVVTMKAIQVQCPQ